MKPTDNKNIPEKPIFTIEDTDDNASQHGMLEEPVITIESDDSVDDDYSIRSNRSSEIHCSCMMDYSLKDEPAMYSYAPPAFAKKRSRLRTWGLRLLWLAGTVALVLVCYKAIRLYNYYYNIGVSISVSPRDNIRKLDGMKSGNGPSEVVLKSDSVLGVAVNIYELHNVKAEMTLEEPDTADRSILLYTRTADYTATGKYLGSLVIGGKEMQSNVSRLGYCAILDGNMVIGVSRFDDLKKHTMACGGSYFRQFMLVSNGELPRRFYLHGKVERKALARTADDHICIVETCHPETLWDFADALREYGYVDAVYLTGGNVCGFYRAPDGTARFTEKAARYRTAKHHGVAPWLVLRKK